MSELRDAGEGRGPDGAAPPEPTGNPAPLVVHVIAPAPPVAPPTGDVAYVELGKNPAPMVLAGLPFGAAASVFVVANLKLDWSMGGLLGAAIWLGVPVLAHYATRLASPDRCSVCSARLARDADACTACGRVIAGVIDARGRLVVDAELRATGPWASHRGARDVNEYRWAPEVIGDLARVRDSALEGAADTPEIRAAHERGDEAALAELLYERKRSLVKEPQKAAVERFRLDRRRRLRPAPRAIVRHLLGTGLRVLGKDDIDAADGSHVTTLYLCLFYMPLVPIAQFLAMPLVPKAGAVADELRGPYALFANVPMTGFYRAWRGSFVLVAAAVLWGVLKSTVLP